MQLASFFWPPAPKMPKYFKSHVFSLYCRLFKSYDIAMTSSGSPSFLSVRRSVRLRPDCQRVISDVRPVSLLCHERPGNRELLRQPVHLQQWAPFYSPIILAASFDAANWRILTAVLCFFAAPGSSSGMLQGVLLTLSMCLVLLALLVLVLWLHRTGQDGRLREGKEEEEECYNEIRYTPSLMKRSFVWFLNIHRNWRKKKGVKTSKTLFHVDNFLQPSLCFLYSTAVLYSITNFQINAKFPISVLFCFQETSTVVLHMIYFQGFLQFPQNQRRPWNIHDLLALIIDPKTHQKTTLHLFF